MMPYSLHVALLLAACWLFYKLLLQNETYYHLNRVLLLACIALAFLLPLVPVPQQYSMRSATNIAQQKTTTAQTDRVAAAPASTTITAPKSATAPATATTTAPATVTINMRSIVQWAFWLYWCGVIAFGANFLLQIAVLIYQAYRKPAIRDGQFRIVELDGDKAPCSFGNNIFINPAKYDWETYNQILMHEKVHVQQGHSVDLVIAELMLVLQWFNPFAWLYRKEMESNMEFLTDDAVIQQHKVAAEDYQMSLLKVSVPNYSMRITTNYNQSLLKRRIMMMNTKRSNIQSMWKYFMLMPFMAILLCGFNEPVDTSINPLMAAASKVGSKISATLMPDTAKTKKQISNALTGVKTSATQAPVIAAAPLTAKKLTAGDIQLLDQAGISADYIKSFVDIGYKDISLANITGFDNLGITADYVKSFMDLGFDVRPSTIHALENAGIAADYIKGFKDIKYPNLTIATVLAFDNAGISADYVKSLMDTGFPDLTVATIMAFDNAGISADFVKGFKDIGYKDLTVATIMAFDNSGISAAYVKGLQNAGFKDLSVANILALDNAGTGAEYVKGLMNSGLKEPSAASILAFDNAGISPDYIKAMMSLKINGLTPAAILALDNQGVSVDYAKALVTSGLKKIKPGDILALDNQGVSIDYIKAVLDAGLKDVTVTEIMAFDNAGVSVDYIKSLTKMGLKDLTPSTIINKSKKGN
jgi:beta-lactamase regulating signal transducer with metallopeptidase domain